jgi:drug/metabolite transporter (DMT)-like permease
MSSPDANRKGIFLMTLAMGLYVLNDTCVKLVTAHQPTGQILAIRGVFATLVVLGLALHARALASVKVLLRPVIALRAGLEVTTAVTSIGALAYMTVADVTAVMLAAPLLITLFVITTRSEEVPMGRIVAAVVGFAGVMLVLKPGSQTNMNAGAVLALLCSLSLASRDLVTRRIPREIPTVLIAMVTTMAVAVFGFAMGIVELWQPVRLREVLLLAGAAVFAALGNYALIAACRDTDLSVVTPFRYTIIVWAIIGGLAIWGTVPDLMAATGMCLICLCGWHTLRSARAGAPQKPVPAEPTRTTG